MSELNSEQVDKRIFDMVDEARDHWMHRTKDAEAEIRRLRDALARIAGKQSALKTDQEIAAEALRGVTT